LEPFFALPKAGLLFFTRVSMPRFVPKKSNREEMVIRKTSPILAEKQFKKY